MTHICAPVFMFTAGLGAYFRLSRGRTRGELSRFLWTRGLWLVVLELTVLRVAMDSGMVLLSVLWALGWSMVALGFLVHLPMRVLAIVSIAAVALHNLADGVRVAQFGAAGWVWNIFHQPGVFMLGGATVLAAYPLVPWIFVMAAGFCFGEVMALDEARRRRYLTWIGLGMTLAFVTIRAINGYGDPQPWTTRFPGMTVLSFLRCTKYPPSLDFLLMTLGPAILLLVLLERVRLGPEHPFLVFGRTPLFYFLGHLVLAHALTIPFALARYGHAGFLLHPLPSMGGNAKLYPEGFGYSLPVAYGVWVLVVAAMYPLCRWFARLRERRRDWWLSYL